MRSLDEVHKRGLIHRDISPDNIMVLPDGKVRLLDLGAAKEISIENNGNSQLVTKKGFSPAEQYMDSGKIGTWTDVYALCATIYYCITGKLVPDAMERLMGDTLSFDVPMKKPLSGEMKRILQKGLAIKAEERIQTVEELARGLQNTVLPPISSRTQNHHSEQEAASKKRKPRTGKSVIGVAGAVVILLIAVLIYRSNRSEDNSETETDSPAVAEVNESIEPESSILTAGSESDAAEETLALTEEPEENAYLQNVLMEDSLTFAEDEERWVLGNDKLARSSIVAITFLDTLKDMPQEDAWDVSQEQNGSVMAWTKPSGQEQAGFDLYIAADGGLVAASANSLFAGYENATKINFDHCFHTDQITDFHAMFYGCNSLKNLDLSDFDTSRVTNMYYMFCSCGSLENLDLSSFDTSQVTNMHNMFGGCSRLEEIDLSGFTTSRVTDMHFMFNLCSSLRELDLSGFDTGHVTTMGAMFQQCSSLEHLDISSFDTRQVTDMGYMFAGCSSLKELDLSSFVINPETKTENMLYDAGVTAQDAGLSQ